MALKPCKECKKEISTDAKTCPQCGASNSTGSSARVIKAILYLLLFGFVINIISKIGSSEGTVAPTNSETVAPTVAEVPAKPPKTPAEIKKILATFKKNTDKMEGVTWYSSHPLGGTNSTRVEAYMGQKNAHFWLRMKIMFQDETWLFVKGYKFLIDGQTTDVPFDHFKVERDNSGGSVWEWVDVKMTPEYYQLLKSVAASKSAEIRFQGQQYYKDRKISASEKKSIANMFAAFEELGGVVD